MEAVASDNGLAAFVSARRRLFGIAYRMLGSAAEAEDLLQEVWMRWYSMDRSAVVNAPAFLATITTRLAINVAQSARARRESYVGPWLPEPVDTGDDPQLGAERGEALAFAVLVLLEKLSPPERAAYVLREAFNYPYEEIADILRSSEANARQLVSRARKHVAEGRRARVSTDEQQRLLEAFVAASQRGDAAGLERLFASEVVSYSDGGGVVHAARRPVVGRARVARFIGALGSHFWTGVTLESVAVNGQPALLFLRGGVVGGLVTISASAQGIDEIMWMMRPSKLVALSGAAPR